VAEVFTIMPMVMFILGIGEMTGLMEWDNISFKMVIILNKIKIYI
jgi:hypothetical protein